MAASYINVFLTTQIHFVGLKQVVKIARPPPTHTQMKSRSTKQNSLLLDLTTKGRWIIINRSGFCQVRPLRWLNGMQRKGSNLEITCLLIWSLTYFFTAIISCCTFLKMYFLRDCS